MKISVPPRAGKTAAVTDHPDQCTPDPRPGFYYVSAIDGARRALVRGPWVDDHAGALAAVDACRRAAADRDGRTWFYAFGTCRSETDLGAGWLGGPIDVAAPGAES